ncbi:MAG: PEP-CTERM sorting domain-containing protein [Planctomycetota bacterium]
MKINLTAVAYVCLSVCATTVQAASTSTPYLFTSQPVASTGHFEWDEFANVVPSGPLGPHLPDVASSGIGSADLSVSDPNGFAVFGPIITSTQNVYSGSELVDFTIDLSGLSTADANTTVVLQVGVAGSLDDFLLDGVAPTHFVDRGTADVTSVRPDTTTSTQSVRHYWASWDIAAATDYDITFGNPSGNTSMTHARVDYFNSASPFTAVPAGNVPEPTTFALAGLAVSLLVAKRRR